VFKGESLTGFERKPQPPAPARRPRAVSRIESMLLGLFLLAAFFAPVSLSAQTLQPGGPVNFGPVALGKTSNTTILSFYATAPTTISSVLVTTDGSSNQDFVLVSQNCVGTLLQFESCNITLAFSPLQIGLRKGALSIIEGNGSVGNRTYLHGVGLGPQLLLGPVSATAMATVSPLSPSGFTPTAEVYDGAGDLYFNDIANGRILELSAGGTLSTVANLVGAAQSAMTIAGDGTLYISSPSQHAIEVIAPTGALSTLSTTPLTLTNPTGVAADFLGFLYIADSQANQIIRVALDGSGATVVPLTGLTSPLSGPTGLTLDNDNLYIADSGNNRLIALSFATGTASVINPGGGLSNPTGIAVDASGTIIAANTGAGNILQVTPSGTVFSFPIAAGVTTATTPRAIALKPNGDLVSADSTLGLVTITRNNPSITFPTPTKIEVFDATDGYATLTLQNSGNQPVQLTGVTDPAFSGPGFALGNTGTCASLPSTSGTPPPLSPSTVCTYTVGFTPTVIGPNTAVLSVNGTATGTGAPASATAQLSGTGLTNITSLQVTASPTVTSQGVPVSFTVTAFINAAVATDFVGTITFTTTDSTGVFLSGTSYTFTAADAGAHTFPAVTGAQFNQVGVFTISAHIASLVGISNTVTVTNLPQISLTSSVNPSFVNQQTTLTATLQPPAGSNAPTPTGSVTFMNGTAVLGTVTLINGQATFPTSFSTAGTYSLTVVYQGSSTYAGATSAVVSQVVNDYAAHVSLTSSANPVFINTSFNLTATVVAATGQGTTPIPTGTVTFMNGTAVLGTVTLVNGQASLPVSFSIAGTYPLTVVYQGDTNYVGVTSPVVSQVVNDYAARVSLTSSANPTTFNSPITLTATVVAAAGQGTPPVPTGTVTFKNGTAVLGTATLVNGQASLPVSFSTPGTYTLTVVYGGDTSYLTANSLPLSQVITDYTAQVFLTSSVSPTLIDTPFTLTATVAAAPGQGTLPAPTGTVTFLNGTTPLGTATVVAGQAALAVTINAIGTYNITAVYFGDTTFLTATSRAINEVVEDFSIAVTTGSSGTATVLGGYSTTYSFTVTPLGGTTLIAPVTFGLAGFPTGTTATFSPTTVATGSGSSPVTLTVKPPAAQAHLDRQNQLRRTVTHDAPIILAFLLLPFAFLRRRRRPATLLLWLLLCASAIGLTGCITDASSGYYGNNPGTYTLTVVASSGTLSHATTVTLIVQ
jgi:sugar lactone lactonase YvrE